MFRLYCGLMRDGDWFNYAEIVPLEGGVLAMLDGTDKTGAARLLNLMRGSVKKLYTEDRKEYEMKQEDYNDLYLPDTWKIGYEQIKNTTRNDYPIIPENFFCDVCSSPHNERFTKVEESWQKLIEDGLIDEKFLDNYEDVFYEVELPNPITVEPNKTIIGGDFYKLKLRQLRISDMAKIHRNREALENSALMVYLTWEASIVDVIGLNERDFNVIKRIPNGNFVQKYIAYCNENIDALRDAIDENSVGIIPDDREVVCKYCGAPIGGGLDFTNFFLPLLPKKSNRSRMKNVAI